MPRKERDPRQDKLKKLAILAIGDTCRSCSRCLPRDSESHGQREL